MTAMYLSVPALKDTPWDTTSRDCSAPPAGTQRALPCVLAFGVVPHDGLPQRLQPPDVVHTFAEMVFGSRTERFMPIIVQSDPRRRDASERDRRRQHDVARRILRFGEMVMLIKIKSSGIVWVSTVDLSNETERLVAPCERRDTDVLAGPQRSRTAQPAGRIDRVHIC
jgi:hypothetical protein